MQFTPDALYGLCETIYRELGRRHQHFDISPLEKYSKDGTYTTEPHTKKGIPTTYRESKIFHVSKLYRIITLGHYQIDVLNKASTVALNFEKETHYDHECGHIKTTYNWLKACTTPCVFGSGDSSEIIYLMDLLNRKAVLSETKAPKENKTKKEILKFKNNFNNIVEKYYINPGATFLPHRLVRLSQHSKEDMKIFNALLNEKWNSRAFEIYFINCLEAILGLPLTGYPHNDTFYDG